MYADVVAVYANFRYTVPHLHGTVPKSKQFIDEVVPLYDDERFKILFRVSRKTFYVILDLIKDDPVFRSRGRGRPQYPIHLQLQVVLYRLGSSGEASSIAKIAFLFGLGDGGTIQNFVARVFSAILKLQNRFIFWPGENERKTIEKATYHEMPFCIGYVDGTEVRLAEKPFIDSDSYLSRKQQYSIKAQIICDHTFRIRHVVVGYPGSVHDSRIFRNCPIGTNSERYFSSQQYLLGDSAYKLSSTVITPFRINARGIGASPAGKKFNRTLGKYRVRIENTIGLVKERFSSLKELKIPLIDSDSSKLICDWVLVCCILHNIIRETNNQADSISFEELTRAYEEDEGDLEFEGNENTTGESRRQALVNLLA